MPHGHPLSRAREEGDGFSPGGCGLRSDAPRLRAGRGALAGAGVVGTAAQIGLVTGLDEAAAVLSVIGGNGQALVPDEFAGGRVDGVAVWPPRGEAGFGYDPLFLPDGFNRTFGQISSTNHRAASTLAG